MGFYFPNDTTGDEYYTYQWFKASNLQGANLSQVGDTTNTLTNVSAVVKRQVFLFLVLTFLLGTILLLCLLTTCGDSQWVLLS